MQKVDMLRWPLPTLNAQKIEEEERYQKRKMRASPAAIAIYNWVDSLVSCMEDEQLFLANILLDCVPLDFVNLDFAEQNQIEAWYSDERTPSPSGKGKEEDRSSEAEQGQIEAWYSDERTPSPSGKGKEEDRSGEVADRAGCKTPEPRKVTDSLTLKGERGYLVWKAAEKGLLDIVLALIKDDAEIFEEDRQFALRLAFYHHHHDVAKVLLGDRSKLSEELQDYAAQEAYHTILRRLRSSWDAHTGAS